jgi:hypothetical protein
MRHLLIGAALVVGAAAGGCSGDAVFTSGGTASGGNGGNGAGGAGTAGNADGGGGNGTGGAGASWPQPECQRPIDCQLVDGCCSCEGYPAAQPPPPCDLEECLTNVCSTYGIGSPAATCAVGRCVLDVSCDGADATCDAPEPECPAGEAAAVIGGCWGGCIPATECAKVGRCGQCSGPDQVCVVEAAQVGPVRHCVKKVAECSGAADCACMGATVCLDPFDTCGTGPAGEIVCECVDC